METTLPWFYNLHENEVYRAIQDGSLDMKDFKKWLSHEKHKSWSRGHDDAFYDH